MKAGPAKYTIFLLLIFNGVLSCTNKPVDHSLPLETYMELGVPDPTTTWELEDYEQTYNALAQRKWEHSLELPAKDSEKSGSLFERMTSLDCLTFLRDTTLSLSVKAQRISESTKVYKYWMDLYSVPTIDKYHYRREIVDVQIFNLRIMEAMVNLAQEINKSDDPADMALRYGYESIKRNYLTCLDNDLKTQRSASGFLKHDLDRMADSICISVMRSRGWMDSNVVAELNRSLRWVIDSTSSDYIKTKYINLGKLLSVHD